jgi:hypothetical protein
LFLACWGPKLIWDILAKIGFSDYSDALYMTKVAIDLLPFIHTCVNPVIYAFTAARFRKQTRAFLARHPLLARVFCVGCSCRPAAHADVSPGDPRLLRRRHALAPTRENLDVQVTVTYNARSNAYPIRPNVGNF